jgi:hypothetical protein
LPDLNRKITIKKIAKILFYLLVIILSLIITISIIIRNPSFQNFAIHMTSEYLSRKLGSEVTIRGFNLSLTKGLLVEDIMIRDRENQVLFSAHVLGVIPKKISIRKHDIEIRKVFIDKGVIQLITHKNDSILNLQHLIDFFSSPDTTKKTDTTPGRPWKFLVSRIELAETRFHLLDENTPRVDTGMDYANIDVNHINLVINDFRPDGDTMNANIESLSAIERSGIAIRSMSGEFHVGPRFLKAHNLKLRTNHSDLDLSFDFLYPEWQAYNDFLNRVTIHASIAPTTLDLSDIGAFAPIMYRMKDRFRISGMIRGTVSNFHAKNFKVAFGTNTTFWGNISANGLPNVEETFVDLNIKTFTTNKLDIVSFYLPGDTRTIPVPEFLGNAGLFRLKGNFTGFYNDFVASGNLDTDIGSITTDLSLKKQKGRAPLAYKGELDVTGLRMGDLFKSKGLLGKLTLRGDINGKGLDLKTADVTMNVHVDSVGINNYVYRNIAINGILSDKKFTGILGIKDPNIKLDFKGLVDFSDSIPKFNFTSTITHAKLFTLNILKRDSVIDLSTQLVVDFTGSTIDNINGSIIVDSTRYIEGEDTISMKTMSLLTTRDAKDSKSYFLHSDFVDADISGEFKFSELIPSFTSFVRNYLASFRMRDTLVKLHPSTGQFVKYKISLKNSDPVMKVFLPFLRIAAGTRLDGFYSEDPGLIVLTGGSPSVSVYGIRLSDWYINARNRPNDLDIHTGCKRISFKNEVTTDSLLINMDSVELVSNIRQDSIHYDLSWMNPESHSDINGFVSIHNNPAIEFKFNRFNVFIDHKYWQISPGNYIVLDTSSITLTDLTFSSGKQALGLSGKISHSPADTLYTSFTKMDISDLDRVTGNSNLDVDGILEGKLKVANVYKSPTFLTDLRVDSLKFNGEPLGDATFVIYYESGEKKFDVKSQIIYTGNVGKNIPFSVMGSVYLGEKNPRLDLDVSLKNLNLKMISPFVSSFMSGVNGLVSGDVRVTGKPSKPIMHGTIKLMRTEFKINYLNVPYSLADVVTVDSNAFNFNRITIYDSLGHKAMLNGKISHHNFKDIRLDLNIDVEDFSAFRNTYAQNSVFYGNARASGNVRISGPLDDISIDVKARTTGNTHVVIPISSAADLSQSDYIIFENTRKDTLATFRKHLSGPRKGLWLNIAIMVTPDASVEVFFPDQLGNIKGSGSGNLIMSMTPTTGFVLSGAYMIQKGSFLFQLKNLMRLTFTLLDGGRISWTGDPANADIAVNAVYKTRVPLEGVTSEPEMAAKRIPVECIIRLKGKLMNPDISFSLNLPNVQEDIRTTVYNAIDTTNPAVMNQQMIYLLVFNQFYSVQTAGSVNVDVGSTSMSILTNQVNGWLSKISKDVNVGINYQQGNSSVPKELDVAVSTQLFGDRLLVDGLFGMNSYTSTSQAAQQASTIVGDINIEYILTKNRRLRVRAFNRTNTIDILTNNAPYTQGVGISYQRDFNKIGDIFRKEKKTKEEKPPKKK